MANISDYLDWRGDLSFAASPFNEVDNYILAKIGCADFTGIVSEQAVSIPIGQAVERYFFRYGEAGNYFGALASDSIGPMLRRLPETARFRELRLSGFVNRVIPKITEQFSALTLTLPDGSHYVSFRGTDDTIAAWKENFMMSLDGTVPAQRDAAEYLLWTASAYPGPLIVGGHSKGGNLAVYAAASVPAEVQARITAVYNNDGPGFDEAFLASEGYQRIAPKLITLLPQYSIVGTLLTQAENCTIVKSGKPGVAAHDGFNWEVRGAAFLRCEHLSRRSQAFDETMQEMLGRMDQDERAEFIDTFFGMLSSTGAETLTEIGEHRLRKALELTRELRKEKTVQRFAVDAAEQMLKEYVNIVAAQRRLTAVGRLHRKK